MTPFIVLSILFCLMGNVNTFGQLGVNCGRGIIIEKIRFGINSESKNSEKCLQKLSYFKKAFFTDQYGNTKEKISFSDYLNHYKSAGYEFPKEAIETEADKFYEHANGVGYKTKTCWGCGNGDGHMNLQELLRMETSANRDMYV
jgi:hypothetical protein